MDDFEKKVAEVVANKLNDGTVEKLIEQKLEESIKKTLEDVFGYCGEGKKLLEKKLNDVMIPVIERHDFNAYLVKLDEVLTSIINQTNLEDNKKILNNFKELLKEPDRKEIKASEIFEKYCEHVAENIDTSDLEAYCEDGEPYYEHVTANMEVEHINKEWFSSNFDDCFVNFICNEDENLNCQIKLYKGVKKDEWRIINCGNEIDINSLRRLSDFEVFLSVIQRSWTKIILDTESTYNDDIEPLEKPEYMLG